MAKDIVIFLLNYAENDETREYYNVTYIKPSNLHVVLYVSSLTCIGNILEFFGSKYFMYFTDSLYHDTTALL